MAASTSTSVSTDRVDTATVSSAAGHSHGYDHGNAHLYLRLYRHGNGVVLVVNTPPKLPCEKKAQHALRGGQAHGHRASFDTDDAAACARPPPTFREMR